MHVSTVEKYAYYAGYTAPTSQGGPYGHFVTWILEQVRVALLTYVIPV